MNQYNQNFEFLMLDDAVEISIQQAKRKIERKIDTEHQNFIDNVVIPFEIRCNNRIKREAKHDKIMSDPILRGIYNFGKALLKLKNSGFSPNTLEDYNVFGI